MAQCNPELRRIGLEIGPGHRASGVADAVLAAVHEGARGIPVGAVTAHERVDRGVEAARSLVGDGSGIVAHNFAEAHRLQHRIVAGRVAAGGGAVLVELVGGVHLELEVVVREGVDADMTRHDVVGRSADTVGPR